MSSPEIGLRVVEVDDCGVVTIEIPDDQQEAWFAATGIRFDDVEQMQKFVTEALMTYVDKQIGITADQRADENLVINRLD